MLRQQLRRATPVIFVTGAGDDDDMRRAYEFGAVDYLVKPVNADVLRGKVRNLIALYEQGLELERRAALLLQQQDRLIEAGLVARRQDTNIGIVAHDLRNPLGVVTMAAHTLRNLPDLPPQARKLGERIDRSANRMALMISDILDFTRGHLGGGIPVSTQPIDFDVVSRSIVEEVAAAHSTANIEIQVSGDLRVSWDRARVEQALSNLLANAVQHGRGNKATLLIVGDDPNELVVQVHNEGDPIPPDQIPTLFEAFRKGTKSPAGLGLGLFIVREIARAHGGDVEVESSIGGTTFTMRLPRRVASHGEGRVSSGDC
jgi:signal transduction histidine kinase